MTDKKQKKLIAFYLDKLTYQAIKDLSNKRGVSESIMIRDLIRLETIK